MGTCGPNRVLLDDPTPAIPFGLWVYYQRGRALVGGTLSDCESVVERAWNTLNLPTDDRTLDEVLSELEPRPHGLTVLPFLSGERNLGWIGNATAAINGPRLTTTAIDILQISVEPTAYRFSKD